MSFLAAGVVVRPAVLELLLVWYGREQWRRTGSGMQTSALPSSRSRKPSAPGNVPK